MMDFKPCFLLLPVICIFATSFCVIAIGKTPDKMQMVQVKLLNTFRIPIVYSASDWAVSPDGKFIAYNNKIVSVDRSHTVITLPFHNDMISSIVWAHSGRRIVVCSDDAHVYLLKRLPGGIKHWKIRLIMVHWDAARFTPDETGLVGIWGIWKDRSGKRATMKEGVDVLQLSETGADAVRTVKVFSQGGLFDNNPLLPYAGNRVMLIPMRLLVSSNCKCVPLSYNICISTGVYDLCTGPLGEKWYINARQKTILEEPYGIQKWVSTHLVLLSLDGARKQRLLWNSKQRIISFQTVGKNILWVLLDTNEEKDYETLRQYKITRL